MSDLPENTVVDGEIVALDDARRPNFNLLQHTRSQASRICFFVFDLLVYQNRDLTQLPFIERLQIMNFALKFGSPRIGTAQHFEVSAEEMARAVRQQGLEGVHVLEVFDLSRPETNAYNELLTRTKEEIKQADSAVTGFNIGINNGEVAGQTVPHCHVHLIPRRVGDVPNPRGGVRKVLSGKSPY